jgi:cellobiose-specific phosphotransferase system component IIC
VPTQSLGVGRLLIAIYAIFAISATARASYQLIREFDQAPLAYSLSAISALVYVLATISLTKQQAKWQRIAKFTIWFELIGVIVVGTLSLLLPDLFAHPSVWSGFGAGYAFIPLLLPVLGLIWLRKHNAGNN